MQPLLFSLSPWLAAIVLMAFSASAAATDDGRIPAPPAATEAAPQPVSFDPGELWKPAHPQAVLSVSANDTSVHEFGPPVDSAALADLSGGYDAAENLIDVDGSVEGNTAHDVVAGANTISDGAFANASGLSTVIQNSGSNVLIQNAMIVKVDFGGSGP